MNDGATPVYIAAQNGYKDTVELLLYLGADINQARNDGLHSYMSPSEWSQGHRRLLASHGADVNHANKNGCTPMYAAAKKGHTDIVGLLEFLALSKPRKQRWLRAVFVAAFHGHTKTVDLLVSLGADVNQTRKDNGATPVWIAAYNGHTETVSSSSLGADVNRADEDGATLCGSLSETTVPTRC